MGTLIGLFQFSPHEVFQSQLHYKNRVYYLLTGLCGIEGVWYVGKRERRGLNKFLPRKEGLFDGGVITGSPDMPLVKLIYNQQSRICM